MDNATITSKTSPKDFFLWLGALVSFYAGIALFIVLGFEYVNYLLPDALDYYGDPYAGAVRFAISGLIVFVPTFLVLKHLIRSTIDAESGKAHIWVRRWAIMLTIFLSLLALLIDLITIINLYLGGEVSERFFAKAGLVLLVASAVFAYSMAESKGYWQNNQKHARAVGIATILLVISFISLSFIIIGSPADIRAKRMDNERVNTLQNIQYQIISFWQTKQRLPNQLTELNDLLSGYTVPLDPETNEPYEYKVTSANSFALCAVFDSSSTINRNERSVPTQMYGVEMWEHASGRVCFDRTIDAERYPFTQTPK